jgi:hypothetical protein
MSVYTVHIYILVLYSAHSDIFVNDTSSLRIMWKYQPAAYKFIFDSILWLLKVQYSVKMCVCKYKQVLAALFLLYLANSYMLNILYLAGLDTGDRQILEHRYASCEPPCLLDSSDGR